LRRTCKDYLKIDLNKRLNENSKSLDSIKNIWIINCSLEGEESKELLEEFFKKI
jgi:hypothetical protein